MTELTRDELFRLGSRGIYITKDNCHAIAIGLMRDMDRLIETVEAAWARVENYLAIAASETERADQADALAEKAQQAYYQQANEIDQILGKALGYPWYKDDQKNFPGATEANGVCTGDHVPESLAMEAAARLAQAERERDEATDLKAGEETAQRFYRSMDGDLAEMTEISRFERERAEAAEALNAQLVAAGSAVLYHDERGQGVGYAEAMDALRDALAAAKARNEGRA